MASNNKKKFLSPGDWLRWPLISVGRLMHLKVSWGTDLSWTWLWGSASSCKLIRQLSSTFPSSFLGQRANQGTFLGCSRVRRQQAPLHKQTSSSSLNHVCLIAYWPRWCRWPFSQSVCGKLYSGRVDIFFFFNKLLNLSMRQVVTQQLEPGGAFSETIRFLCSFLRSEEMFNYYWGKKRVTQWK